MEVFTWIVTGIAVLGVILNIKKRVEGFHLWTLSNAAWIYIDHKAGLDAQAGMFVVYTGLSIWGIYEWRKVPKPKKE